FDLTNFTFLKLAARRSHRDKSASAKSTSMKSFQHKIDSVKSVPLKLTDRISDRPKKVRAKERLFNDTFSTEMRKIETPGSSSSWRGCLCGWGGMRFPSNKPKP